jgi:hypothetical protein
MPPIAGYTAGADAPICRVRRHRRDRSSAWMFCVSLKDTSGCMWRGESAILCALPNRAVWDSLARLEHGKG